MGKDELKILLAPRVAIPEDGGTHARGNLRNRSGEKGVKMKKGVLWLIRSKKRPSAADQLGGAAQPVDGAPALQMPDPSVTLLPGHGVDAEQLHRLMLETWKDCGLVSAPPSVAEDEMLGRLLTIFASRAARADVAKALAGVVRSVCQIGRQRWADRCKDTSAMRGLEEEDLTPDAQRSALQPVAQKGHELDALRATACHLYQEDAATVRLRQDSLIRGMSRAWTRITGTPTLVRATWVVAATCAAEFELVSPDLRQARWPGIPVMIQGEIPRARAYTKKFVEVQSLAAAAKTREAPVVTDEIARWLRVLQEHEPAAEVDRPSVARER